MALPPDKSLFEGLLQEIDSLSSNNNSSEDRPETVPGTLVKQLLRDSHGRGVLLLGHERNRLLEYAGEGCDLCLGQVRDRRGFNSLLCLPELDGLRDWWNAVVLLDGDLLPGEAAFIRRQCPGARLMALQPNPALKDQLKEMSLLDRTAVGALYLALKKQVPSEPGHLTEATGLTLHRLLCAAMALHQAGLAKYQP